MEPIAPSENRAESNRSALGAPPKNKNNKNLTRQGWGSPRDCCRVGKWFSSKRAYAAHVGFSSCAAHKNARLLLDPSHPMGPEHRYYRVA